MKISQELHEKITNYCKIHTYEVFDSFYTLEKSEIEELLNNGIDSYIDNMYENNIDYIIQIEEEC